MSANNRKERETAGNPGGFQKCLGCLRKESAGWNWMNAR